MLEECIVNQKMQLMKRNKSLIKSKWVNILKTKWIKFLQVNIKQFLTFILHKILHEAIILPVKKLYVFKEINLKNKCNNPLMNMILMKWYILIQDCVIVKLKNNWQTN